MNINSRKDQHNSDLPVIIFLFILALGIRLYRLFSLDVWFDEVVILFQIKQSFVGIWDFCKNENFPPLYPWLAKLWGYVLPGENWIRFFSALSGAAIPPLAYVLGKEIEDKKLGLLLGLACALSLPLIYYSQVARMYSLFVIFACLSYIGFIRALKTNEWKYWALVAAVNLLGFYTFLFFIFIIIAQCLLLCWYHRLQWQKYYRPLIAHLPTFVLMLFWVFTLFSRFKVQQTYAPLGLLKKHYINMWAYFGTGHNFNDHYWTTIVLNLPFFIGFLLSIPSWFKKPARFSLAVTFCLTVLAVLALINFAKPIFSGRYLLFLMPIYLGFALSGWLRLDKAILRYAGIGLTFAVLLIALIYYHVNFIAVNDALRYEGAFHSAPDDDGRSGSRLAGIIKDRIQPHEAIIHYSERLQRSFSFFPMAYFHQRSLPEYIYSREEIIAYCGQQYLLPREWIRSLNDLKPLPEGVWVVTLSPPELILDKTYASKALGAQEDKELWIDQENLPLELQQAGYHSQEVVRCSSVSAIHYRREAHE